MDPFDTNSHRVACSLPLAFRSRTRLVRWCFAADRGAVAVSRPARAGSRYAAFASAVEDAQAVEASDAPMTDHELRVLVSRAVRRGSIAAMRLYLDILELDRLRGTPKPEDPLAFADELRGEASPAPGGFMTQSGPRNPRGLAGPPHDPQRVSARRSSGSGLEQADEDVDQDGEADREQEGCHQAAGHEADLGPPARPLGEQEHASSDATRERRRRVPGWCRPRSRGRGCPTWQGHD